MTLTDVCVHVPGLMLFFKKIKSVVVYPEKMARTRANVIMLFTCLWVLCARHSGAHFNNLHHLLVRIVTISHF